MEVLNPKAVGIVEVTKTLNTLADVLEVEVTEDRVAEMLPLKLSVVLMSTSW